MTIGILTLDLLLNGCQSLKEKRQILKGLKIKIRDSFNVSIADIDHQDKWQRAALGIACISTDKQFVNSMLDKVLDFVRAEPRVVLADHQLEML